MNKIFILGLLIGFSLSLKSSTENSECVTAEPNGPQDCFNKTTEYFEQTCCYFIGSYKDDENSEYKHGPACLEAFRIDVSTGEKKAETQKKIENGEYWKDYPPIKNIESFVCYSPISECEKIQPAKDEDECFSAQPELTSDKCCYVESDWVEGDKYEKNLKYCADIRIDDSKTRNLLEETVITRKKGYATNIKKIKCFSTSLKINLLALALVLFIF